MSKPKRAALYIRVSTDEQARHGYSLAEQEYDLRRYAEQQDYAVVDLYADEGASARKALSRRKGLQRLLEDVQTGSIGRALRNRAYLGEYYGIKGFCPAIIDEGLFAQAQKVFVNRTRHPHSKMTYLFWGLLRCPECGRLLTPRNRELRGKIYTYYTCRNHTHGRECPHKTYWREDHVETALLTSLEFELRRYLADVNKVTHDADAQAVTIEELRTKQARLKELYVEGLIQREEFDMRYSELNAQIVALRPQATVNLAYMETVAADDLVERYERLSKQMRKMFWSRILDQVRLTGGSPKPVFRAF